MTGKATMVSPRGIGQTQYMLVNICMRYVLGNVAYMYVHLDIYLLEYIGVSASKFNIW